MTIKVWDKINKDWLDNYEEIFIDEDMNVYKMITEDRHNTPYIEIEEIESPENYEVYINPK